MHAEFHPVATGVTGATEIQVTSGLNAGDEVVSGRFKTLRTLHSGTPIKLDTSADSAGPDAAS